MTEHQMHQRSRFLIHSMWAELEKIAAVTPKGLLMHAQRITSKARKSQQALGGWRYMPGSKEWKASSKVKARRKKHVRALEGKLKERERGLTKAIASGKQQGRANAELKKVREAQEGFGWFGATKRPKSGRAPTEKDIRDLGTSKRPRKIGKDSVPETPSPKESKGVFRRAAAMVSKDPNAALGVAAGSTLAVGGLTVAGKKYLESRQAPQYTYG